MTQHVLIVDDDDTIRFLLEKVILRAGYTCAAVHNGQLAVDAAAAENFDLIFMDVKMPIMGGLQATQLIREFCSENLTIIGYSANSEKSACIEAGMNDYLPKPSRLEDIIGMLRNWLGEPKTEAPLVLTPT